MGSRGNFHYNYPKVIKYLNENDIEYEEFNGGQHLKIVGHAVLLELWPSRMKYHLLEAEDTSEFGYESLGYWFDEEKFRQLLDGELL